MPPLTGGVIRIDFQNAPRSCNRRLESGPGPGLQVHAAGFLRGRRVVLDEALRRRPGELSRILIHELFHFVWLRAGNPARRSWERLLAGEADRGARGELGWSAERNKLELAPRDRRLRTRAWREYVCESFCDSAAWMWSRRSGHSEYTLAPRYRRKRREWFLDFLAGRDVRV
jgi:hypothetical protein